MLRRGSEPVGKARSGDLDLSLMPAPPTAAVGGPDAVPPGLGSWTAPVSYLSLDPAVLAELVRAALGSPTVASLRNGELAVGAMLASLAVRGEDILIDELLPLANVELRVHRYAVGQLSPLAVHPVSSVPQLLRSLARCAVQPQGETWEAVAHDGRNDPVAVAAARSGELRWLQPPAPGAPHAAPWVDPTTPSPAPGATVEEWTARLSAIPPAAVAPAPPTAVASEPVPAFGLAPRTAPIAGGEDLAAIVGAAVEQALANAPIELDLDAATLDELRDTTVLERLVEAIGRLERQVGQVDAIGRQMAALTAAVDDLADSTRSLLRHQWDNMPPQGFWLRVQKADDEVRRAVDELAAEVRGRLRQSRPTSPRS
jgi:hypothetical protein